MMKWIDGTRRDDFNWQRTPLAQDALAGKKVAVVGGTNGIGRAFAHTLAAKGAEVIVVGRTFRDEGAERISFIQADLSQMEQARRTAQELPIETLDAMIFTTGIMPGKKREENPEGIESDLAVSYLSRFVMVREAAERLGKNRANSEGKPRVFVVGFPGTDQKGDIDDLNSEGEYSLMTAHSNTVIGNEALVLDAVARYPQVNFYGLNPGLKKSNIRAGMLGEGSLVQGAAEFVIGLMVESVEDYSERIAPLFVSPDIEAQSGALFNRHGDPICPSRELTDAANLQKVIEASEKLTSRALGAAG